MSAVADDCLIVGGGASGLAAAIQLARRGARVRLLERTKRPGQKLLLSGGGRCNLSNRRINPGDYVSEAPRAVRAVLSAFDFDKTTGFFESIGVSIEMEDEGKCFPSDKKAGTVLAALARELKRLEVPVSTGVSIDSLKPASDLWLAEGEGGVFKARTVLLACGGSTWPETGSDGSGFLMAAGLGHRMTPLKPALVPIESPGGGFGSLAGVSTPVAIELRGFEGRLVHESGPLLFTHSGFSGPAILNASLHLSRHPDLTFWINWLPGKAEASLLDELKERPRGGSQPLAGLLSELLPKRLAAHLAQEADIPLGLSTAGLDRARRKRLLDILYRYKPAIRIPTSFDRAEVTSGGVSFDSIDHRTLESKVCPGLFFAGEILDVAGRVGGYNLQWAWSSAFVASQGLLRRIKDRV